MTALVTLIAAPLASSAVLARSDDFPWPKLIGFGLVLVVWAIGALASVMQKGKKRPEQTWTGDRVPPVATTPSPPVPPTRASTPSRASPPRVAIPPLPPLPSAARRAGGGIVNPPPITAPRPAGKKANVAKRREASMGPPQPLVSRSSGNSAGTAPAADIRRRLLAGGARVPLGLTDLFDPPPSARP